ncbi:transmembrane emp24 domain-containing protein 5-like [Actinia tenebrosa]|uniref:Transmembrane emp24 domain-containing protein 5-like n=1 Tax=Actinia tenebrosa TaxID=6105 RepID=A0A6P8HPZ0_ACTTE|nr:transmembrane emp24 domain-containing protein 5-like [Actinia tenebrosa]
MDFLRSSFKMAWFLLFLFFIQVVILPTSEALKSGFTIKVEAGNKECFFEEIKSNVSLDVEYQVVEGGELDINFYLKQPNGKILLEDVQKSDETHNIITPEDGVYEFCFDNSFSSLSSRTVFADLGVDFNDDDDDDNEITTRGLKDTLDGLETETIVEALIKIRANLERVDHIQNFLRSTEARDFKMATSNLNRVFWWSLIQSVALIGVALVQVNVVKHFFGGGKYKARV